MIDLLNEKKKLLVAVGGSECLTRHTIKSGENSLNFHSMRVCMAWRETKEIQGESHQKNKNKTIEYKFIEFTLLF